MDRGPDEDLLPLRISMWSSPSSELNPLVSMNRSPVDLFSVQSPKLSGNSPNDPKHLGPEIGEYRYSTHLGAEPHDLPTSIVLYRGGLSPTEAAGAHPGKRFFIPSGVMSAVVQREVLDLLRKCFKSVPFRFPTRINHLSPPEDFEHQAPTLS